MVLARKSADPGPSEIPPSKRLVRNFHRSLYTVLPVLYEKPSPEQLRAQKLREASAADREIQRAIRRRNVPPKRKPFFLILPAFYCGLVVGFVILVSGKPSALLFDFLSGSGESRSESTQIANLSPSVSGIRNIQLSGDFPVKVKVNKTAQVRTPSGTPAVNADNLVDVVFPEKPRAIAPAQTMKDDSRVPDSRLPDSKLTEEARAATAAQVYASASVESRRAADMELHDDMSRVKFIAGMIAVHLPTIPDCGSLAKDIVDISSQEQIDPFYVAAIISVESRFGTEAKSKAGATGLMQLLPGTAREVLQDLTGRKGRPMLTDARTNLRLGIEYIKDLQAHFHGNRYYALAAYNWGVSNVDEALARGRAVPRSVSSYAQTILKRSVAWKAHFGKAESGASALARSKLMADS